MCLVATHISSLVKYMFKSFANLKTESGTSLVVQWLRICLSTQGTQVQAPVGKLRSHMPQNSQGCNESQPRSDTDTNKYFKKLIYIPYYIF